MSDLNALFSSFTLRGLTIPNRIAMAPMTRRFSPGGIFSQQNIDYYKARADNGVGLIISEGACINHPAASGEPNVPFIGREDTFEGWQRLAEAVHASGSTLMPQIWHVGATRRPGIEPGGDLPGYSPSGYVTAGKLTGKAMSQTDIDETIEAYATAAKQAKEAGCDGVEIHGAHGYLIDQFFWDVTNLREDQYGGDLAGRSTFGIEVIKAVRAAVGDDFPVLFRFSQWKQQNYDAKLCETPEQLGEFIKPLADAGVDAFHCSTRRFWEPEFEGSELNLAGWVKKLSGVPTVTVGSVGLDHDFLPTGKEIVFSPGQTASLEGLLQRLEAGEFDLVAVGRALIANADWARKVERGEFESLQGFDASMLANL